MQRLISEGLGLSLLVSLRMERFLDKASTPTPETLEELLAWLDQRLSEQDYRGIAMSVPGAVNQETGGD